MKAAELKALDSSGRGKPWLVHYLQAPAGYLDDADSWAAYLDSDEAAERDAFAQSNAAAIEFGRRHGGGVEAQEPAALRQQLEQRRAELDAWRRDELAKALQIAAWLRGTGGEPPLLALMKGAA